MNATTAALLIVDIIDTRRCTPRAQRPEKPQIRQVVASSKMKRSTKGKTTR